MIPSLAPGGTERQLLYLLAGLSDTHDCSVVCTRRGGAWSDVARVANANVIELDSRGGWDLRIRGRARRAFATLRPHIVQTFLFGVELSVIRAARDAAVPIVITSRRELAAWMKPRHLRAQHKANAMVDSIVANSHAVARFAADQEGMDAARIRVIHNGINASAFAATAGSDASASTVTLPTGKKIVGMVANFSAVKDHPLFVATAKRLLQCRLDIHFLLVGSGPLQKSIETLIDQFQMRHNFTITSTLDDSGSYLRMMDVCVLTSQREGFPNAVLEAMALGRPIVAAAVGGVPELIEDEVSGLLVSSRDPIVFAESILRCLNDSNLAKNLGERAQAHVESEFPVTKMVDSYRALYSELMAHVGASN